MGSHGLNAKGPAMYDEIARIPFLVSWADQAPSETVCNHPVSHIDIVPTIMDAFGLEIPKCVEGKSMISTFKPQIFESMTVSLWNLVDMK